MRKTETKKVIDQALEQLATALARGQSEALTKYLAALARFPAYSVGNILLILAQRPQASRIAGFRTWQRLGRHVKRGERGILITAPIIVGRAGGDTPARGPPTHEEDDTLLRFKAVYVFDISQTEGRPLPEPARVGGNP